MPSYNVRNASTLPLASRTARWSARHLHPSLCPTMKISLCEFPKLHFSQKSVEIYFNWYSGLANGTFTIYSSDHCPFRYDHPHGKPSGVLEHKPSMEGEIEHQHEGKELQDLLRRKQGAFRFIPNGIPGVETRLPLLYTGALAKGRISPQRFVELTSTNPAKLVRTRSLLCFCFLWMLIRGSMACTQGKARWCLDPMPTWWLYDFLPR